MFSGINDIKIRIRRASLSHQFKLAGDLQLQIDTKISPFPATTREKVHLHLGMKTEKTWHMIS